MLVRGLDTPWAIDFAPDGRAFVTKRAGRIRVIRDCQLVEEPWLTLGAAAELGWLDTSGRPVPGLAGVRVRAPQSTGAGVATGDRAAVCERARAERDVVEGPDGALYPLTSNRDGRGQPAAEDDRIIKLSLQ